MLSENIIRDIYNERRVEMSGCPPSEFSIEEVLLGNNVKNVRKIDSGQDNPRTLTSIDFDNGESLVFGLEGNGEDYNIHLLWIDKEERDRYSSAHDLIYND